MARLILMVLFVAAIVIAVTSVESLLRRPEPPAPKPQEGAMPKQVRTIAYVALIVVMFGATTGWLVGS